MKIVLSSREIIWGGGEVFLSDLARELIEMGHNVILRVEKNSQLARHNPHIPRISRMRSCKSDLVILNDFRSVWQSNFVDRSRHRAFVVHGEWQWSPLRARISKRMKIAVHPVSRFVADYGRSVGVDWPQCILPLGPRPKKSEIASFKSIPNSENITIGTIARLDPIKRLELFRDVVTMGKWNGIVVCPEPQTSAEMAVLQSLTESENIEVIHTANASNQIAKFDIFLSTSISESLGLSHLEALQFGKPVLTTALHGPPEFMSGPLQIGILKDSDPAELVKQIRTAISAYQVTVADYSRHAARELAARGPHACAMQILGSSS